MHRPVLALAAFAALAIGSLPLACGGGPAGASWPGAADVAKAQSGWCAMLAEKKALPEGDKGACEGADVTGSAAYVRLMTKCIAGRLDAAAEDAVDHRQMAADCTDAVTLELPLDQGEGKEVLAARCDRMVRCEKVTLDECKVGVEKLESAQRAIFTTTYNHAALSEVADCLGSKGCTDDEDAAREACYTPVRERLLWFPE